MMDDDFTKPDIRSIGEEKKKIIAGLLKLAEDVLMDETSDDYSFEQRVVEVRSGWNGVEADIEYIIRRTEKKPKREDWF